MFPYVHFIRVFVVVFCFVEQLWRVTDIVIGVVVCFNIFFLVVKKVRVVGIESVVKVAKMGWKGKQLFLIFVGTLITIVTLIKIFRVIIPWWFQYVCIFFVAMVTSIWWIWHHSHGNFRNVRDLLLRGPVTGVPMITCNTSYIHPVE